MAKHKDKKHAKKMARKAEAKLQAEELAMKEVTALAEKLIKVLREEKANEKLGLMALLLIAGTTLHHMLSEDSVPKAVRRVMLLPLHNHIMWMMAGAFGIAPKVYNPGSDMVQ